MVMSQPFIVYGAKHIAQNLRCDPRTVASRIAKLGIEPVCLDVTGTPFYLRDALEKLEAAELEAEPVAAEHEVAVS